MNRKKLVLYILLAVLALSAGRAIFSGPGPGSGSAPEKKSSSPPPSVRPPARGGVEGAAAPPGEEGVRLDLLNREREPFREPRRDLFASLYREKPAVSPPSMPALPPPPPLPPMPFPPPSPVAPPPPQPPGWAAQQELARFTYLGFLEKKGVKTIFLSASDEIFVVKQGDHFGRGGQFQVTQITPERLVVRQENDPRPITIPLVEQAPLAPARGFPGRPAAPRSGFPGRVPGGMPGSAPPPEEIFTPEETTPEEEPPPEEESGSPFISPGQLGSQGVLQPLRPPPAPAPQIPPPPGPAFNQPAR